MSQENEREYITEDTSPSKTEETSRIISLVNDIYKLEDKISCLKNQANFEDNSDNKNKELENLKKNKKKLNKEINELTVNTLIDTSNKENKIKKSIYLIKELKKKINNYKNILTTYNTLSFSSPILKKYILSNKMNQFLTDEQIDDIMSKTQTIYKNDNLIQKTEKEISLNREELNNIENNTKKIIYKINEIEENLKMMKEEKNTFKNELVNYISLKETLESIIKVNLPSILKIIKEDKEENNEDENKSESKNFNNEKNSFISNKDYPYQNKGNTINSLSEDGNENENNIEYIDMNLSFFNINNQNIKSKKNWDEIIKLYKYELFYLDPNRISTGICNEIFDLLSSKIINETTFGNNLNKFRSSAFENQKSSKILLKVKPSNINSKFSKTNPLTFSYESPKVKKSKVNILMLSDITDIKKNVQNEIKNELQYFITNMNTYKISVQKLIEKISDIILIKLRESGIFLNKKNLMIYLSCFFKASFYDSMISMKLKFINKDYKNIKKDKRKKLDNLNDQLIKHNTKSETIKNTIILQENKLKLLKSNNNSIDNIDNKKSKEKEILKSNNNNGNLKLTLDEQNYIQLCRKANSFINEKNEIEREIDEIENDKKLNKYQTEIKINSLKNEIKDIDSQINSLENDNFEKKVKSDEEISKCRQLITDKYNIIKQNLGKYKTKCSNTSEFNKFIDNISSNFKDKYYKTLLQLEKLNIKNNNRSMSSDNKNLEKKSSMENYIDLENENMYQTTRSNMFSSHKKTSSDLGSRYFTFGEENNFPESGPKDYLLNNFINSTSRKQNNIFSDNRNRIKNNNYINVFDSCNNLNNYFFQFQTPSTIINIDNNKNNRKNNNFIFNTNNKKNKNLINILSYSSAFTSSKKSNSNKKIYSPNNGIKPRNLLNNLKSCESDKRRIYYRNNNLENNMKIISLNKNSFNNLYKSNPKLIRNNLLNKDNYSNLFSIISKDNSIYNSDIKSNQINSLFKRTFCYFRIFNNKDKYQMYNPLNNISIEELCKFPYNFIKSTLNFDKMEDMIKIFPSNQLDSIDIKIDKIENSLITSEMKLIIDIFKGFRKYKNMHDNEDINEYIKKLKKGNISYNHLKDEDIKRCCLNKNFIFNINIKDKKIIEFLFCSYEEFKLWNNAISFFIKKNNEFSLNFCNSNRFKYP